MKVLTIRQPWASLIMLGYKRFEFRSWRTNYRGGLLIHAGKGIDKEAAKRLEKHLPKDLPFGKILGSVEIVDCIKCDDKFGKMCQKEQKDIYVKTTFEEMYAWELANIQMLDNPIEVKGKLGLWDYDIIENKVKETI